MQDYLKVMYVDYIYTHFIGHYIAYENLWSSRAKMLTQGEEELSYMCLPKNDIIPG